MIIKADLFDMGTACTVLLARDAIDNDNPMMIANCDKYIDADINSYLAAQQGPDGLIMTIWADFPKRFFARRNPEGRATGVVEKEEMSNKAIVCIHNSAQGRDFVCPADTVIVGDLRVNGEFYVTPAYDRLIAEGGKIVFDSIGGGGSGTYGINTLADLAAFFALPLSRQATDGLSQAGSKT